MCKQSMESLQEFAVESVTVTRFKEGNYPMPRGCNGGQTYTRVDEQQN